MIREVKVFVDSNRGKPSRVDLFWNKYTPTRWARKVSGSIENLAPGNPVSIQVQSDHLAVLCDGSYKKVFRSGAYASALSRAHITCIENSEGCDAKDIQIILNKLSGNSQIRAGDILNELGFNVVDNEGKKVNLTSSWEDFYNNYHERKTWNDCYFDFGYSIKFGLFCGLITGGILHYYARNVWQVGDFAEHWISMAGLSIGMIVAAGICAVPKSLEYLVGNISYLFRKARRYLSYRQFVSDRLYVEDRKKGVVEDSESDKRVFGRVGRKFLGNYTLDWEFESLQNMLQRILERRKNYWDLVWRDLCLVSNKTCPKSVLIEFLMSDREEVRQIAMARLQDDFTRDDLASAVEVKIYPDTAEFVAPRVSTPKGVNGFVQAFGLNRVANILSFDVINTWLEVVGEKQLIDGLLKGIEYSRGSLLETKNFERSWEEFFPGDPGDYGTMVGNQVWYQRDPVGPGNITKVEKGEIITYEKIADISYLSRYVSHADPPLKKKVLDAADKISQSLRVALEIGKPTFVCGEIVEEHVSYRQ